MELSVKAQLKAWTGRRSARVVRKVGKGRARRMAVERLGSWVKEVRRRPCAVDRLNEKPRVPRLMYSAPQR